MKKKENKEDASMGAKADYLTKHYSPLLSKNLRQAVAHRIAKEFPRIGGPRMVERCAELVLEVVDSHLKPRERVGPGQMVWMAISVDDPPAQWKRTADTDQVAVVLDVATLGDIQSVLDRRPYQQRWEDRLARLSQQAYEQKALLSNCDLAAIFNITPTHVSRIISVYEDRNGQVVPRRATIHDVGSGLTHKRIICRKRVLEGKSTHQIAEETYHTPESVDRYLAQYDRVRLCRINGMTPEKTAYMLNCGISLVREYLAIDDEMKEKNV
jgi:hypothetical protein